MEKNSTLSATHGYISRESQPQRRPKASTIARLRMLARAAYSIPAATSMPLLILN